ncbi:MAG: type I-C CRISPR-associated protein Cas7/Csd2 [Christensenellales bacterium]|jgi:CRISPR-associated protein Csd2
MSLTNKIDFAVIFTVRRANPNGDPLNGNRPRIDYDGYGEVSDVCLKRKLRNRLQDMGESIFVQSDDRRNDAYKSLKERAENCAELMKFNDGKHPEQFAQAACAQWMDVRAFGQVFAYKTLGSDKNVSIGVRGPVSIHSAVSVSPVQTFEMQITKSVNNEPPSREGIGKSSDTMGTKHRVDFGVYVTYGSINTQLASKTGFSDEDAEKLLEALRTLFENDASSARPDGSMEVVRVYWWRHNAPTGQYSSAKVHGSLQIKPKTGVIDPRSLDDYDTILSPLEGLSCTVYDGI